MACCFIMHGDIFIWTYYLSFIGMALYSDWMWAGWLGYQFPVGAGVLLHLCRLWRLLVFVIVAMVANRGNLPWVKNGRILNLIFYAHLRSKCPLSGYIRKGMEEDWKVRSSNRTKPRDVFLLRKYPDWFCDPPSPISMNSRPTRAWCWPFTTI